MVFRGFLGLMTRQTKGLLRSLVIILMTKAVNAFVI